MYIDVRTKEEWEEKNIEGTLLLPLADIMNGTLPDVSKDTLLQVFCVSGARASIAILILKQNGFSNVENVGGIDSIR